MMTHWHSLPRRLIGLVETPFDRLLRRHRRRLLDRLGVVLLVVGLGFIVIAIIAGDAGTLAAGDWIAAGSVLVTAGGLLLTVGTSGPPSTPDPP